MQSDMYLLAGFIQIVKPEILHNLHNIYNTIAIVA